MKDKYNNLPIHVFKYVKLNELINVNNFITFYLRYIIVLFLLC